MTQGHQRNPANHDVAQPRSRSRPLALLMAVLGTLLSTPVLADTPDDRINAMFAPIATAISNVVFYPIPVGNGASMPAMVLWLIIAATFFTLFFRFINIRGFKQGLRLIRGDYSHHHDKGEVTHFQA